MTDRLDKIRALVEDERDTAEHCIDVDHADYLLAENEQLTAGLVAADEECDRLMDLYLAQRREHNKAAAEVERLREELEDRRVAMYQIYWMTLEPRVEQICDVVYHRWGGVDHVGTATTEGGES